MLALHSHPERDRFLKQLRENRVLRGMTAAQWRELEPLLGISDYRKGELLVRQGEREMAQFFILDGMLKRVVSDAHGREMILRFAAKAEMDTSYAARRLGTSIPYSIVAASQVTTAQLAMQAWVDFLDRHPHLKTVFELEVMKVMLEVMQHSVGLHLASAPDRLLQFRSKRPELAGRISSKDIAAYLNLSPETLTRLKQKLA